MKTAPEAQRMLFAALYEAVSKAFVQVQADADDLAQLLSRVDCCLFRPDPS